MDITSQIELNNFIIIDNKHLGQVIKILWNGNGWIVKLIGEDGFKDSILSQYNLLKEIPKSSENHGYMVVTKNNKIEKPNSENLSGLINLFLLNNNTNLTNSINIKVRNNFNNFIQNKLFTNTTTTSNLTNTNSILPVNPLKLQTYKIQDMNEDNYAKYILKMIKDIFIDDDKVLLIEENPALSNVQTKSTDILSEENINKTIKPTIKKVLEEYNPVNLEYYYDFKDSLAYRHIILNQDDTILSGSKLIEQIRNNLYQTQSKMMMDDGDKMLQEINLFDFIEFKIVDGYVEIINKFLPKDNFRVISEENCPDLEQLSEMYGENINYKKLVNLILENKTPQLIQENQQIILEGIKILSLEYLICIQPKVEFLLWFINRIILAWYADPYLYENIYKIKILINLYRARGIKQFNQDTDVLPIITVVPRYGKTIARKVMSLLSFYLFPYKRYFLPNSNPTYFNKLDDMMYYTNGSLDLKKYIKFILGKKQDNIFNKDLTQVKTNSFTNKNDLQYGN